MKFTKSPFIGYALSLVSPSSQTSSELSPTSPNDTTSTIANTTATTPSFEVVCSGGWFGYNPSLSDCHSAIDHIAPEHVQYQWAERHQGLGGDVFPLPFRMMGDRGLCFYQTLIAMDHGPIAHASLFQIRRAANALLMQCAANMTESTGGVAYNIGGDNHLSVVLGVYRPNVRCHGSFGTGWQSCRDVLGDMPADKLIQRFGPRGEADVQVGLPTLIDSSDNKCALKIFTTGNPDVSRWYRMWEAATAVYSVCVRAGRSGSFRGLGDGGNIFLSLSAAPSLQLPGNETTTTTNIERM